MTSETGRAAVSEDLMDYPAHDRVRYVPSRREALEQGHRALHAIHKWLPDDRTSPILEIGCGAGNLLLALSAAGYSSVSGVDLSPVLVRHGQQVLEVDSHQGDWGSEVARAGTSYGAIVALDVVEHLMPESVQSILSATASRLGPNGRLILRLPNVRCPFVLPMFHGDLTHRMLVAPDLLEHLLRTAGFKGRILFAETRPHNRLKRVVFTIVHYLLVKPIVSSLYFHFYQRLPRVITRNIYCCAFVSGTSE